MAHAHRARREDGDVGAALALQLQLRALEARADLVVVDAERALRRDVLGILQRRDLALAPLLELAGRGVVVCVCGVGPPPPPRRALGAAALALVSAIDATDRPVPRAGPGPRRPAVRTPPCSPACAGRSRSVTGTSY